MERNAKVYYEFDDVKKAHGRISKVLVVWWPRGRRVPESIIDVL